MGSTVLFQRHDSRISILTLNRPEKRNALTIELMDALCDQIQSLEADEACRVVILGGAGPVFCAGLDLIEAADFAVAQRSADHVAKTFSCITNSPLVTIAAVHGAAMAGGAGLMSACDLVVAADDLKVGFPEVRRGLVPALVAEVLRKRLRDSEMRELFLMAEQIDVRRAHQLGLVQRIVTAERLIDDAIAVAETVCRGGPEAVRMTKRLIHQVCSAEEAESVDRALDMHTVARKSREAEEGFAAFREKRKPNW